MTDKSPITVTDAAAEKLLSILTSEGKDISKPGLRLFVQGGGCSGFQYGLALLDEEPNPTDLIFESNKVKFVIDPVSLSYLKGAEIDLVESILGDGFKITNPNASSTCGCGQSFEPKSEDEPKSEE